MLAVSELLMVSNSLSGLEDVSPRTITSTSTGWVVAPTWATDPEVPGIEENSHQHHQNNQRSADIENTNFAE